MDKKREKPDVSADIEATVTDNLKRFVAIAAGPPNWTDSIESMLWRAAQRLGIEQRRAKAFWYREAPKLSAVEYLSVQQRAHELLQRAENHARALDEAAEIRNRTRASLAGRTDRLPGEDFHERNRATEQEGGGNR